MAAWLQEVMWPQGMFRPPKLSWGRGWMLPVTFPGSTRELGERRAGWWLESLD